jgi:hypothetical protein
VYNIRISLYSSLYCPSVFYAFREPFSIYDNQSLCSLAKTLNNFIIFCISVINVFAQLNRSMCLLTSGLSLFYIKVRKKFFIITYIVLSSDVSYKNHIPGCCCSILLITVFPSISLLTPKNNCSRTTVEVDKYMICFVSLLSIINYKIPSSFISVGENCRSEIFSLLQKNISVLNAGLLPVVIA